MDRTVIEETELEVKVKPVEIIHLGDFDLFVNNLAKKSECVRVLVITMKAKIGSDHVEPLAGWVETSKGRWRDSVNLPKYFAKKKWMDKKSYFDLVALQHRDSYSRKEDRRYNSLSNEFRISDTIRSVVGRDDFQQVAGGHGFESLQFIEPLVGFVDRRTGDKVVIYGFVPGAGDFDRLDGEVDSNIPVELVNSLRKKFNDVGIYPTDLRQSQFITRQTRTGEALCLIDIEGYLKES